MGKRKTTIEFKQEVAKQGNHEYEVLSDYINNKTKVTFKHLVCGHTFQMIPSNFLRGQRCPICANKQRALKQRKSNEKFKQEVAEQGNHEYEVLSDYINAKTNIIFKHLVCEHTFAMLPDSFLRGSRCPWCAGNHKYTTEEFKQEVAKQGNHEYEILGDYINANIEVTFKHLVCGHTFQMIPSSFLQGHRCPWCFSTPKKTTKEFKQEVAEQGNHEYEVLSDYINNKTKVTFKHLICGHTFTTLPTNFLRGHRCPWCFGNHKKTTKEFKQEVAEQGNHEYEVLSDYVNAKTKITFKHLACGRTFQMKPHHFLQGERCPYCNTSHGELMILNYLKRCHINYCYQKTFANLKDKQSLSYDFYLSDYNLLIEYQGIQHYHPVDIFGGIEQFKLQQQHDKMKRQYAHDNHYRLLEIGYWCDTQDKVNDLLNKKLYKCKY